MANIPSHLPYATKVALKVKELEAKGVRQGDCLISHLAPNAKGYIPVQPGGRAGPKLRANRMICEAYHGPAPTPQHGALHTCHNRACIEQLHLYWGTAQQNTDDMIAANRQARLGRPAIAAPLLREAVALRDEGKSYNEIARIQGLTGGTGAMDRVRRGRLL